MTLVVPLVLIAAVFALTHPTVVGSPAQVRDSLVQVGGQESDWGSASGPVGLSGELRRSVGPPVGDKTTKASSDKSAKDDKSDKGDKKKKRHKKKAGEPDKSGTGKKASKDGKDKKKDKKSKDSSDKSTPSKAVVKPSRTAHKPTSPPKPTHSGAAERASQQETSVTRLNEMGEIETSAFDPVPMGPPTGRDVTRTPSPIPLEPPPPVRSSPAPSKTHGSSSFKPSGTSTRSSPPTHKPSVQRITPSRTPSPPSSSGRTPSRPPSRPPQRTTSPRGSGSPIHIPGDFEGLPPEERMYSFISLKNATYEEFLDIFAQQSGLTIIGDVPPQGRVTVVPSDRDLTYAEALRRVRTQLFIYRPLEPWWALRDGENLKILRFADVYRQLKPEEMYADVETFLTAALHNEDAAYVKYTPLFGSVSDLEHLHMFMPDYARIAPVPGSNAMGIFALVKDIKKYIALAEFFGSEEDPRPIECIPCTYVLPSEAIRQLNRMMTSKQTGSSSIRTSPRPPSSRSTGSTTIGRIPEPEVTMVPFDDHKEIFVRAMPAKIREIKRLMPFIDRGPTSNPPVIIKLEHAKADDMAKLIQQIIAAESSKSPQGTRVTSSGGRTTITARTGAVSAGNVSIIPSPGSNELIVIADDEGVARVRSLVQMFDSPTETGPIGVELKHVSASEVVATINQVLGGVKTSPGLGGVQRRAIPGREDKVIWITGSVKDLAQMRELIAAIDVPQADVSLHIVRLKNQSPSFMANFLRQYDGAGAGTTAFKPGSKTAAARARQAGKFTPDDQTKRLWVLCTNEEWETYLPLIEQADEEKTEALTLIEVKHIEPDEAISMISRLIPVGAQKGGPAKRYAPAKGAIIVYGASESDVDDIRALLEAIDQPDGLIQRTFTIKHADPKELVAVIEALAMGGAGPRPPATKAGVHRAGGASSDDATVVPFGQNLIVRATPEKMGEIAAVIIEFDVDADDSEIRTYKFAEGVDVVSIANTLPDMLPGDRAVRPGTRPTPGAKIGPKFIPQQAANKLIVIAPKTLYPKIEEAIDILGADASGAPVMRAIALKKADPQEMVRVIQQMMNARKGRGPVVKGRPAGGGTTFTIVAQPGGGGVVVNGQPSDVALAAGWIEELDNAAASGQEIKIYQIVNADVEQLVNIIMNVVDTGPKARPGGRPGGSQEEDEWGFEVSIERVGKDVYLQADLINDTIMVASTPAKIEQIDAIVAKFDPPEGEGVAGLLPLAELPIKTYTLKHVDAFDAVDLLNSLLEVLWRPRNELPEVDYIPWTDILVIRYPKEERLTEVVEIIREHVDIAAEGADEIRRVILPVPPNMSARDAAEQLQGRLGNVNIERIGGPGAQERGLVTRVHPPRERGDQKEPEKEQETKEGSRGASGSSGCVLPLSLQRFEMALTSALPGQVADDDNAEASKKSRKKDKDKGEKKNKGKKGGKRDGKKKADVHTGEPEEVEAPPVVERMSAPVMQASLGTAPAEAAWSQETAEQPPLQDPNEGTSGQAVEAAPEPQTEPQSEPEAEPAFVPQSPDPAEPGEAAQQEPPEVRVLPGPAVEDEQTEEPDDDEETEDPDDKETEEPDDKETEEPELTQLKVYYDEVENVLIVEGIGQDVEDLEEALETLVEDYAPTKPDIRIYRIKYIDLYLAQEIVEEMFNTPRAEVQAIQRQQQLIRQQQLQQQRQQQQQQQAKRGAEQAGKGQQPQPAKPGQQPTKQPTVQQIPQLPPTNVRVYANPRDRTLIIRANTGDYPALLELLATIDQPQVDVREFRRYPLEKLEAAEVEKNLKTFLGLSDRPMSPEQRLKAAGNGMLLPRSIQDKTVLPDGYVVSPSQIRLTSNAASNTIIAQAPPAVLDYIGELLDHMESFDLPKPRILELKYTKPTVVAEAVMMAYTGAQATRGGQKGRLKITGYDPTKQLFVSAPDDKTFEEIKSLVENTLDKPREEVEFKIYILEHANARVVYERMKSMLTEWVKAKRMAGDKSAMEAFAVDVDDAANALIVLGGPETFAFVERALEKVDTPIAASGEIVNAMYLLKRANAVEVARNITNMFKARKSKAPAPQVEANKDLNLLIVRATKAQQEEIERDFIKKLDEMQPPALKSEAIKLTHGNPAVVAEIVQGIINQRIEAIRKQKVSVGPLETTVAITPDVDTGQILVLASEENMKLIKDRIAMLDTEEASEKGTLKTIPYRLRFADPNTVRTIITQWSQVRRGGGRGKGGGAVAVRDIVQAVVEWTTQSVVVTASEENHERIRELIAELDKDSGKGRVREIYFLEQMARASELANILNQAFRSSSGQRSRQQSEKFSVVANDTLNALVLSGTQEDIDEARTLIADLDQETTGVIVKVYKLNYADPGSVVGTVRGLFPARTRREEDRVSVAYAWPSSLVVGANVENHAKIKDVLDQIDKESSVERQLHHVKLEHGNAGDLARTLSTIFARTQPRKRSDVAAMYISADPATNTLLAFANEQEMERLKTLLEVLDTESDANQIIVKVYKLEYADPSTVANLVRQSFAAKGSRNPADQVRATPGWPDNVVVAASVENHKKIEETIKTIDVASIVQRNEHVIKLQHANAADLGRSLQTFVRNTQARGRREQQPMSVQADAATNSLLVFASDEELERLQGLLDVLDVPDVAGERVIESIKLLHADPSAINNALNMIFRWQRGVRANPRDQVISYPEWGSQSIIVAASPQQMEKVKAFIKSVDEAGTVDRPIHVVEVRNADANAVTRSLQAVFREQRTRSGVPTTIINNPPGTDKIVIRTNDEQYELIKQTIEQMDAEAEGGSEVRIFTLKTVPANEAQRALTDYLRKGTRGGVLTGDARVSVLAGANAVMVSADADVIERVEKVVEELDSAGAGVTEARVIKVAHVKVADIQQSVVDLFSNPPRGRRPIGPLPTIVASDLLNAFIVRATDADFEAIKEFVGLLDSPDADQQKVRVVELKQASAADVARTLTDMYARTRMQTRGGVPPAVISNPRGTNMLIIRAGKDDFEEMQGIIEQMDQTSMETVVRIYLLDKIDATEAGNVLTDFLRKPGTRGGTGELMGDVRLSAVTSSNSLVVTAKEEDFERIEAVIKQLDQGDMGNAAEIIRLVHVNVGQILPTIEQMFTGRAVGVRRNVPPPIVVGNDASNSLIVKASRSDLSAIRDTVSRLDTEENARRRNFLIIPIPSGINVEDLAQQVETAVNEGERAAQSRVGGGRSASVRITADRRTSTLLVTGVPTLFDQVSDTVKELVEMNPAGPEKTRVYRPTNIKADDLKRLLDEMSDRNRSSSSSRRR